MSVGGGQGAADVSDGAEVTRALRESENRLTAVVDNMPAANPPPIVRPCDRVARQEASRGVR